MSLSNIRVNDTSASFKDLKARNLELASLFADKQNNIINVNMTSPSASPNRPQGIIPLDFSLAPIAIASHATFTLNNSEIKELSQVLVTKGPFPDDASANNANLIHVSVQTLQAGSVVLRITNNGGAEFAGLMVFTYLVL